MKMDYDKSVELAIALGYRAVEDDNAYGGVYYIKERLIWIHNLEALKARLQCRTDSDLIHLGYDVEAYRMYRHYSNDMVDRHLKDLYSDLAVHDDEPVYLADGMYLFPDGSVDEL
ncbi:hypothetical protein [Pseudoalteromonas sp. GB56]